MPALSAGNRIAQLARKQREIFLPTLKSSDRRRTRPSSRSSNGLREPDIAAVAPFETDQVGEQRLVERFRLRQSQHGLVVVLAAYSESGRFASTLRGAHVRQKQLDRRAGAVAKRRGALHDAHARRQHEPGSPARKRRRRLFRAQVVAHDGELARSARAIVVCLDAAGLLLAQRIPARHRDVGPNKPRDLRRRPAAA